MDEVGRERMVCKKSDGVCHSRTVFPYFDDEAWVGIEVITSYSLSSMNVNGVMRHDMSQYFPAARQCGSQWRFWFYGIGFVEDAD